MTDRDEVLRLRNLLSITVEELERNGFTGTAKALRDEMARIDRLKLADDGYMARALPDAVSRMVRYTKQMAGQEVAP